MNLIVQQFMTPCPHVIGRDGSLAAAHRLMRDNDIRHLPVLEGGQLVGVVTLRDLHLIETLKDVDPSEVTVGEAMSTDVYSVGPRASVRKIAAEMATHKYGCAIVMQEHEVIGIFTTVDALRVLCGVLEVERKAEH
jgi:acetoin utilization protein AcuB